MYEVQKVTIPDDSSTGHFSINCTILPRSQAKGCAIEVFKKSGEYIFNQEIDRFSSTSSYAVDNISLSINGTYTIFVE